MERFLYYLAKAIVGTKWFFLGDYYNRIAVQARYIYRQSSLFKERWQEVGLDYAEKSFDDDLNGIGQYFAWKARNSPWPIKKQIILDWLLSRPARPYAIRDNSSI